MDEKNMDTLDKLSLPLYEFLKNNCNPHSSIVITESSIQLVETQISIPTKKE